MSEASPIIVHGAQLRTEERVSLQRFAEIAHAQLEAEIQRNGLAGQLACGIVLWHRVDPAVTYATHKWLTREFAVAVGTLHNHFRAPKVGG